MPGPPESPQSPQSPQSPEPVRPGGRQVVVGVGDAAAGFTGRRGPDGTVVEDLVLPVGHHHPSTHGVLRLRLTLDGEVVTACEPLVGHVHRGVEKLFEVRDYRQVLVLANRHDWLSAFSSELGVVLAVERMLGMEVPVRATWGRTLLAELNRVLAHLAFLGAAPVAGPEPGRRAAGLREAVQQVMEELTGGRMHHMFNRVGGLREDLPAGWLDRVEDVVALVRGELPALAALVLEDPELVAASRGVGVLRPDVVDAYGVSGPVARASGVDLDLRRDDPYLAYDELLRDGAFRVVTRPEGDALARLALLVDQVEVSLDCVRACVGRLRELPTGPVGVRLPKILRVPEGTTYAWTENPLGINGYLLVSTGERTPWRLKLRTASFGNVSALAAVLPGCRVRDLVPVLSSFCYVSGDLDK